MSDCVDTTDPFDDSSSGAGYTMEMDTDGDGIAETTAMDFDGDGVADAFHMIDASGGEHITLDTDGDGMLDTVISDFDGDGEFDLAATDTDGDGQLDTALDPETGEEIDPEDPFTTLDEESEIDPEDEGVHGDPMAEIPYHQAQVGPNDCLPTSVAMVLSEITGEEVPQGDIVDLANELDLLGPNGMTIEGGVTLLEHYGVDAEVQTGSMDDLRAMLDADKPVIIGLDSDDLYGEGDAPFESDLVAGHAVVITGIDDEAGLVYINDPGFPDGAGVAISIEDFEDAWEDADHQMIVANAEGEDGGEDGGPSADGFSLADLILMPFNLVVGK